MLHHLIPWYHAERTVFTFAPKGSWHTGDIYIYIYLCFAAMASHGTFKVSTVFWSLHKALDMALWLLKNVLGPAHDSLLNFFQQIMHVLVNRIVPSSSYIPSISHGYLISQIKMSQFSKSLRIMGSQVTGSLEIQKNPARNSVKILFFMEGPMILRDVYFSILFHLFSFTTYYVSIGWNPTPRIPGFSPAWRLTFSGLHLSMESWEGACHTQGIPVDFAHDIPNSANGLAWWFGILGIPLSNNPCHFWGS